MAHMRNLIYEDHNPIYDEVRDFLLSDDLSFTNVEFTIEPNRPVAGYPNFNAPLSYLEAAIDGGIDVMALANNHSHDTFNTGIDSMLNIQEDLVQGYGNQGRDLAWAGIITDERPWGGTDIELEELRIRFYSITSMLNIWLTPQRVPFIEAYPSRRTHRPEVFQEFLDIIAAERPYYDLIIVGYHGGVEYTVEPLAEKERAYHAMVDAGVDIVWGHHPHVLQPWEMVPNGRGGQALIMHSMGNFISGQPRSLGPDQYDYIPDSWSRRGLTLPLAATGDSAIVGVVVRKDSYGTRVFSVEPRLITHFRNPDNQFVIAWLDEAGTGDNNWANYYSKRYEAQKWFLTPRSWVHGYTE